MRIQLRIGPPRVVLDDLRYGGAPAAQATLEVLVHHCRLDEVLHEVLCHLDVLRPLRDKAAAGTDLARHRRAVILVRQAQHLHFLVIALRVLGYDRELGRQCAVEIHHEQLFVVGVIVVGVVPAQRLRRHIAVLVKTRHELDRVYRRLAHLRIVGVQLAVLGDDIQTAVRNQEVVEQIVAVVRSDRGDLQADGVHLAHALGAQLLLHRLEEVPGVVPFLRRNIGHLEAGLLDQVSPDMDRGTRLLHRSQIEGALLRGAVVEAGGQQRGLGELVLLRLDHVGHIDQPVIPRVHRQDNRRCVGEYQVRDIPAGHCGDRLLVQRHERHDAVLDLVAGRLLVVGDRLLERRVLRGNEALPNPDRWPSLPEHWRCRGAPMRPPPPHPRNRESPNAGSC